VAKDQKDIENFEEIYSDYKCWLKDTSNDSLGLSIINTDGYLDWYEWMQENEPDGLL